MPFRIQCPHCRRFMIAEDESRGKDVDCLVCKKPIQAVTTSGGSSGQDPSKIKTCPKCNSRMRVASTAARVRCPKCQHVF